LWTASNQEPASVPQLDVEGEMFSLGNRYCRRVVDGGDFSLEKVAV
jgi:hypothetical protein